MKTNTLFLIVLLFSGCMSIQRKNAEATGITAKHFIRIPGGTYTMGCLDGRDTDCDDDEKPHHEVTVSTFSISKYEVTQAQWRAVMGSDPPYLYNKGCDQCPVEQVSWNDTQEFLQKLNAQTGQNYRLPTEAEWEYAARGGNKSQGYLYSGSNTIGEVAWYSDNAEQGNTHGSKKTTRPVGGKKPNELGLYDMSGNVEEWCSDWYGEDYYQNSPQQNPRGSDEGSYHVLRGGCWYYSPHFSRATSRYYLRPAFGYINIGFRLARTPSQ
jgi:formylglycine-generating enzyme required for sulfatase activity